MEKYDCDDDENYETDVKDNFSLIAIKLTLMIVLKYDDICLR